MTDAQAAQEPPDGPPARLEGTWAEFAADLRTSLDVWRSRWWLPLVTALLGTWNLSATASWGDQPEPVAAPPNDAVAALLFLSLPVLIALALFAIGWSGAERLVYAREWGGKATTFREAYAAAWRYFPRLFRLGLIVLIPLLVGGFALSIALGPRLGGAAAWFVVLVLLTFVTPALVFDTPRASEALPIGVRMLRRQGSGALWYAVIAPAVLVVVTQVLDVTPVLNWLSWPVGGLGALALKGATTAAYLRLTRPAGIATPPPTGH